MALSVSRSVHSEVSPKAMYGGLRQELGEVFRRLAAHRESEVEEGHLLPDHVHMMMSIPPKYSVAQVIGYLKGKMRSTSLGSSRAARVTSWDSTSGPAAISSRRGAR